jgi:hypothetical protein
MPNAYNGKDQQYSNVWVGTNKEVSGAKKLEAAQREADSASTAAVNEPMDVNDVSDYATASEDTLDEMDVEFRRYRSSEFHNGSALEVGK